jgi:protein N-terminal amidase
MLNFMRIACVQFDVQIGRVDANRTRVEALLERIPAAAPPRLIVLPEMALCGYCFTGREEIAPYTEPSHDGPTHALCAAIARRFQCFVAAGFAERGADGAFYNSMMLVRGDGTLAHIYRKHFLYTTDTTWAKEGPGFACRMVDGLGPCAFGICMDVNPKNFTNPFDWFEFASSLVAPPLKPKQRFSPRRHRLRAQLVLLCNNWLRPAADADIPHEHYSAYLMNYWAGRLKPVLDLPVVAVIANRVGVERGVHFAGTSCVLDLKRRAILGALDGVAEDVLLVEDVPLYWESAT